MASAVTHLFFVQSRSMLQKWTHQASQSTALYRLISIVSCSRVLAVWRTHSSHVSAWRHWIEAFWSASSSQELSRGLGAAIFQKWAQNGPQKVDHKNKGISGLPLTSQIPGEATGRLRGKIQLLPPCVYGSPVGRASCQRPVPSHALSTAPKQLASASPGNPNALQEMLRISRNGTVCSMHAMVSTQFLILRPTFILISNFHRFSINLTPSHHGATIAPWRAPSARKCWGHPPSGPPQHSSPAANTAPPRCCALARRDRAPIPEKHRLQ